MAEEYQTGEQALEAAEGLETAETGEQVQETEEQCYKRLEAEIRKEYEAKIDKRVTQALRTFQKKREAEQRAALAAAENERKQKAEQRAAALAEKESLLRVRGTRLTLCDLVAERDLNPAFRNLIPCDDLAEIEDEKERYLLLRDRVTDTYREFNKLVAAEVERQRAEYRR